ncbi:MAG: sugar ABC transporter substrate-binding protein [Patulibacter sp.]
MSTHQPHDAPTPARSIDEAMEQLDTHGVHRRQFVKLLAGSIVAGGTASWLAACGGQPEAKAGSGGAGAATDGQLALLSWSVNSDYGRQWADGFTGAANQLGLKSVILDGQNDATVQLNQFNQLLTQKTRGILIGANDPGATPTFARQSAQNGIYLNTAWGTKPWYTPWDEPTGHYNRYLIGNEFEAVAATVDLLAKEIGEEGTVLRVGGNTGDSTELLRKAGAEWALKKYPKIKYPGTQHTDWSPDQGQKATVALLSRYPDAKAIIAVNDDSAIGVIAGIKQAGKVPGKDVLVLGTNGSVQGIKNVRDGIQFATTGNVPSYPSYISVVDFYDRLNGWKPEVPEQLFTWDAVIITKENVKQYIARYIDLPESQQFSAELLSRTKHPDDFDLQFLARPIKDLDKLWVDIPKPKGWKAPEAYTKAVADGSYDRIAKLYKEHYKTPVLDPSPYKKA